MHDALEQLMDGPTLARLLRIPEATFAQWRYLNRGPKFVKVGRHVRYRPEDVESWLLANCHGGDAA